MEITEKMIERANSYISIVEKEEFVSRNAPNCFDRLQISADGDQMPPMYMENTALKSRYMMYALAKLYFGEKVETERGEDGNETELLTVAEYDKWAGSHVFMQLERMKKNASVRDRIFDIMSDYYSLDKMFDRQLRGLLAVQNDSVMRNGFMMKSDMAELPKLLEELTKLQSKVKE